MVRVPAPHRPSSAVPRINQEYEGHGLVAQSPCDRGYRLNSSRPASAVGEKKPNGAEVKGKGKMEERTCIRIHVHVREKVMTINAGAGTQCVYWLGATAVHRYLSQPHAYTTNFSHEMTAKAVLAEDGAQLVSTARVADELEDGDHVWIHVGDGSVISRVQSRSFPDRGLFEPPGDEFQEQIGWRESEPDKLDDEVVGIDARLTMHYGRTMMAKASSFKDWQKEQPASSSSQEGIFEEFTFLWQQVRLDDMPGSTQWMNDVRVIIYHNYESIKYLFASHATVGPDGTAYVTLLEFWALCKRCALASPWANIAKINKVLFTTKDNEHDPHNPQRSMAMHDFIGALVRLSVLRQKNYLKPAEELPSSISTMLEENVWPLTPGFESFDPDRAAPTPFTSSSVRQKLTIHESRLKELFRKWAVADETRQTINLSEWLAMFTKAEIVDRDLTEDKLREAFVVAQLGDHEGSFARWEEAGEDACTELIFPEFVEAVLRAGLLKCIDDDVTPIDLKIHEVCLLLIFGPAGLWPQKGKAGSSSELSGVERREAKAGSSSGPA